MILALLAVAALAWWLHRDGVLLPNLRRLGVVAGGALIAIRLLETGHVAGAAIVAGSAAWWWTTTRAAATPPADLAAARAILGVAAGADALAVDAAWRRIIVQVHPDRGGSADGAMRVTTARDVLLKAASGRPRRAKQPA